MHYFLKRYANCHYILFNGLSRSFVYVNFCIIHRFGIDLGTFVVCGARTQTSCASRADSHARVCWCPCGARRPLWASRDRLSRTCTNWYAVRTTLHACPHAYTQHSYTHPPTYRTHTNNICIDSFWCPIRLHKFLDFSFIVFLSFPFSSISPKRRWADSNTTRC